MTLLYARSWRRRALVLTEQKPVCGTIPLFLTPYRWRAKLRSIERVIQTLYAILIGVVVRPEVAYVAGPRLATTGLVLKRLFGVPLVFDLMDRIEEFPGIDPMEKVCGERLLDRADLVLCTSETLIADVRERRPAANVLLIPNALDPARAWSSTKPLGRGKPKTELGAVELVLGYFGAVSEWFDFEMLEQVLADRPSWRLRAWGPVDTELKLDGRAQFHDAVAHEQLPLLMATCDVLIMPFRLTRLIEAVDPIKAYEYIATGKPVVLTQYLETERFAAHACLYAPGDAASFVEAVEGALRRSPGDVRGFVMRNTWDARAKVAAERIRELV